MLLYEMDLQVFLNIEHNLKIWNLTSIIYACFIK